jgi:TPP-dependent indolepyruvate ferredoxin oxidoreductase alpha subunit
MPDPETPSTELAAAAHQLHEAYTAYREAGFTEDQAFELVKAILTAGIRGQL